eukprot:13432265-Ditylum_brightwellii.AAC.1
MAYTIWKQQLWGVWRATFRSCEGVSQTQPRTEIASTISVPTMLGGGVHRHIDLVMDTALHSTLSMTAYTAPLAPVQNILPEQVQLVDKVTSERQ